MRTISDCTQSAISIGTYGRSDRLNSSELRADDSKYHDCEHPVEARRLQVYASLRKLVVLNHNFQILWIKIFFSNFCLQASEIYAHFLFCCQPCNSNTLYYVINTTYIDFYICKFVGKNRSMTPWICRHVYKITLLLRYCYNILFRKLVFWHN